MSSGHAMPAPRFVLPGRRTPSRSRAAAVAGLILTLTVALSLACAPASRAEGTVTNASTAALVQALSGGGLVRMTFVEVLTLETPLLIGVDTVLVGDEPSGRQVTLSGGNRFRLLKVLPGVRLEVRNCILRDGLETQGGAIYNEGVLSVSNVTFTACKAVGTPGAPGLPGESRLGIGGDGSNGGHGLEGIGGAVHNLGEATFIDCRFTSNEANGGAGGVGGDAGTGTIRNGRGGDGGNGASGFGGALANDHRASVVRSIFTANAARGGDGGVGGSAANVLGAGRGGAGATAAGGAIHSTGYLWVSQCSFATNLVNAGDSADAGAPNVNIGDDGHPGGSAFGGGIASWSAGAVVNSSFFTNLLVGGDGGNGAAGTFIAGHGGDGGHALGGGIHIRGEMGVTNVTLGWSSGTNGAPGTAATGSRARDGSPGRLAGSAIAADGGSRVTVVNSILVATTIPTTDGPVVDAGHNLFSDRGTGAVVPGSLYHTDPLLDDEFRVWTQGPPGFLPMMDSPALDAGDPAAAPTIDQRGLARPIGPGPDIGALETGGTSYSIAGRVLQGTNGFPGIRVYVGDAVQVTDAQGAFQFGPLASGFYAVELDHDGIGFTPQVIQVALQANVSDLVFEANPLSLEAAHDPTTGILTLRAEGIPTWSYRLEGGGVLGEWTTLATVDADATGAIVFQQNAGVAPHAFYRVISP